MTERLVIVGADAGGMSAASQARRMRGPDDLEIVAFERGNFTSYSACGIPYFLGGTLDDFERLIVRSPEAFGAKQQIDARVRHEVTAIDLDDRAVEMRDPDGNEHREPFDQLVIATGATPLRFEWENGDADGIFGVQILDDALSIARFTEREAVRRAVVVGGGYIGLEMAEAFKMRGLDVTLIEGAPEPMNTLDPDMGTLVREAMLDIDIDVLTNEAVSGFEVNNGRVVAVVTRERTVPADIVALGLGVRPNVDLARAAGIPIGPSGAIAVDRRMQTPIEGVWATGDCAEKFHRVAHRPVAIALGTHANKEGRVAGINIGGGYATFPGIVGTAVTKVCGVEVARTGLTESETAAAGFEFIAQTVDSTTRASYFPGAAPIKTKLIAERRSGRLLGAQIVGKEGAAKRIDVLATMLWNEMTVDQMLNVDLSYAPPFSPLWDPVLIAARKTWQAVEDRG